MSEFSQLPDAEFEVMQIVWSHPAPITSARVSELAAQTKGWHFSTTRTLLRRLTARGFLSSEKHGKELYHTPLITQEEYIKAETDSFMEKFYKRSLRGLMRAMYADKKPSDEDIAEMERWFKEKEE